tara:strand:- start:492 stop:677 length:186 start_codon:yes stop_codon:yes gene_type:complete
MHPREKLLGKVKLYQQRGLPIPLILLAQADELGVDLEILDEPKITTEGEFDNGKSKDHFRN